MQQSISLKQLLLASLCATVLAACGSSGGNSYLDVSSSSGSNSLTGGTGGGGNLGTPGGLTQTEQTQKQEAVERAWFGHGRSPVSNGTSMVEATAVDIVINGKTYSGKKYTNNNDLFFTHYNINDFTQGLSNQSFEVRTNLNNGQTITDLGTVKVYNQPYSFTAGEYYTSMDGQQADSREGYYGGIYTTALPKSSTYIYKGTAFNKDGDNGVLDYQITYTASNNGYGKGKITGLTGYNEISLAQNDINSGVSYEDINTGNTAQINGFYITGAATYTDTSGSQGTGQYELGIFGPDATEIAGAVETGKKYTNPASGQKEDDVISFAGKVQQP